MSPDLNDLNLIGGALSPVISLAAIYLAHRQVQLAKEQLRRTPQASAAPLRRRVAVAKYARAAAILVLVAFSAFMLARTLFQHQSRVLTPAPRDITNPPPGPDQQPKQHPSTQTPLGPTTAESMKPPPALQNPDELETRAAEFMDEFFRHGGDPAAEAITYYQSLYAPRVDFYGTERSPAQIMREKRKVLFDKYPTRSFKLQPGSWKAHCDDQRAVCSVSGIVDWDYSTLYGASRFEDTISFAGGWPQIVKEAGATLERHER